MDPTESDILLKQCKDTLTSVKQDNVLSLQLLQELTSKISEQQKVIQLLTDKIEKPEASKCSERLPEPPIAKRKRQADINMMNDKDIIDNPNNNEPADDKPIIEQEAQESEGEDHGTLNEEKLNEKQQEVFNYVIKLLTDEKFRSMNKTAVLVTGLAGTGKTWFLKYLDNYVRTKLNQDVVVAAYMGVTALNFQHGRTSSSLFPRKILTDDGSDPCRCGLRNNFKNYLLDRIQETSLIIFDHVNMEERRRIEMINTFLQENLDKKLPFGGKIIVFAADFHQLPPIAKDPKLSFKYSELFGQLMHFSFDQIMHGEESYFSYLKDLSKDTREKLSLSDITIVKTIDEVIGFVYKDVFQNPDICSKRVILHPNDEESKLLNRSIMQAFVPKDRIRSYIKADDENVNDFDEEDEKNMLPEEPVILWEGSLCMLVKTDHTARLIVGARVIVVNMGDDVITVRKPNPNCMETIDTIDIERKKFVFDGRKFKQFPLRLCYVTTIHKAQGQIFDKVGVDLRKGVFRHGHLYTAMSRVLNRDDIIVCETNEYTKNVVMDDFII